MKRVLIVTYYWPPSGGIGVLRCLKFAKYLKRMGWEPVVYTALNAQYPFIDHSNDRDVPDGIEILRHPIVEPFSLFKKLTGKKKDTPVSNPLVVTDKKRGLLEKLSIWVRANFFIPDARALWIKPSVRYLSAYLEKNHVDAILSDGPPHTNTMIACRLSQKFGIPWLADFQDPWTQVDYYALFPIGKRADRIHRKLEQEVFNTAQKITIASPTWKRDLEAIGARNVEVIYWGYDEDDFKTLSFNPPKKFVIFHAGIFGKDRFSRALFESLGELRRDRADFAADLEIQLYGMIDESIMQAIQQQNLASHSRISGVVARSNVLQQMAEAFVLLLPLNISNNINGRLPGKLYEYLRMPGWILALGPDTSDVKKILDDTQAGKMADAENKEKIKSELLRFYNLYKSNTARNPKTPEVQVYSVENQTRRIAAYLDEITGS